MSTHVLRPFFGVLADRRAYLGSLYLFLAMPLGILYFTFLVTGLATGLGLVIVWVGLLILAVVLAAGLGLSALERLQATWLLGARVGPLWRGSFRGLAFRARGKAFLANPVTWKGPLFLLLKLPLGIGSFVFAVTAFSLSLGLLAAPVLYQLDELYLDLGPIRVDTFGEALATSAVGFLALILTLHGVRGLSWVWARLSELLLGDRPAAA